MIVTFYSFKGGVGRSMALANVAELLAASGFSVIVCDWDLEAPGLERYFVESQEEAIGYTEKPGVIDLLMEYKETMSQPVTLNEDNSLNPPKFRNPSSWAIELYKQRNSGNELKTGSIKLLTAGKRDKESNKKYTEFVQSFDWTEFYDKWAGGSYIEFFKSNLEQEADFILIDSRTGITEQGGVCTHHLADLVMLFTAANDANIEGTKWMAEKLSRQELIEIRGGRKLMILPVAARIEQTSESKELSNFRDVFKTTFYHYLLSNKNEISIPPNLFESAEIPYIPYYSFKEKIVARENSVTRHRELYNSYENLVKLIAVIGMNAGLINIPAEGWLFDALFEMNLVNKKDVKQDLISILEDHQEWLKSSNKRGRQAVLKGADLTGMALKGYFLQKADLETTNLSGADLNETDLSEANLKGANLTSANLQNANLKNADLQNVLFDNANLEGANLQGAQLTNASFRQADLTNANLEKAVLENTVFIDALLKGTKLTGSISLTQQQVDFSILDNSTDLPTHITRKLSSNEIRFFSNDRSAITTLNEKSQSGIDLIEKSRSILRGEEASVEEILQLSKKLKQIRTFNYARKLLSIALKKSFSDKKLSILLNQQYALCTYKDQDLPLVERLDRAFQILKEERLDLENTVDQETLGLAGAISKRKWEASGQLQDLEESLYYYEKGYKQGYIKDYGYTGINAAYIHDLLAWQESSHTLKVDQTRQGSIMHRRQAEIIRQDIVSILPALSQQPENDWLEHTWWYLVTIAEAYFGLKQYKEALIWIQKALKSKEIPEWEIESTARQFVQLATILEQEKEIQSSNSPAWEILIKLTRGNATAAQTIFAGKAGLALSGGGFRASLYHIGVLARLAEQDMLRHIEVLSCVSGGSIIGAQYYLEIKKLLQTKADDKILRQDYIDIVEKISHDFLDGVQRNIRTRVITNWFQNLKMLLTKNYSRTSRVGELYEEELFSKVKDGEENNERWLHKIFIYPLDNNGNKQIDFKPKYDNWRRKAKVPILILNATTLNTGHNWQFTGSWMGESPAAIQRIDGNYRLRRMYYEREGKLMEERKIRLGHAVAASSCVPGMFEPLALYNLYEDKVVRLVDGGVHDNQGICGLLEQDCSVLLLSDASGQMGSEDDPSTSLLGVPMRANDILMERVRNAEFSDMENRFRAGLLKGKMFVHLKLDLDVKAVDWIKCEDPSDQTLNSSYSKQLTSYGIRKDLQKKLAAIRTDLDSFNDTEAAALMTSGYLMTKSEFDKDITGFPLWKKNAEKWWFLTVSDNLKKEDNSEGFTNLLMVAKEQTFKIWRLSTKLIITAFFLGLVVVAVIIYSVWRWYDEPALTVTIGTIGQILFWIIIGLFVSKTFIQVVRYRKTAVRIGIAVALITLGWLIANLHLYIFDKLYLKKGKLKERDTKNK